MKPYQKIRLLSVVAVVVLAGCAAARVNLVKNGTVSLEIVPSEAGVFVSRAYVVQKGDSLVVSGKVKRPTAGPQLSGHVDIAVISPEGEPVSQVSTTYVPRIIRRKGSRESSFSVELPLVPPQGSLIRVAYHGRVYSDIFDCGDNRAAAG